MPIPVGPRPTARTLARDQAYARIREAILIGTFLPGERLDESELLQWLGVSSTPMRQALYALTIEGLVETAPQAYTRVVAPRPEQVVDYLQALGVLILGHMSLTLPELPESDLTRLISELQAIRDNLERSDLTGVSEASAIYYRDLTTLCKNEPLRRITQQIGRAMGYYVSAVFTDLQFDRDVALYLYDAQIAALRDRKLDDAEAAVRALFGITTDDGLALAGE